MKNVAVVQKQLDIKPIEDWSHRLQAAGATVQSGDFGLVARGLVPQKTDLDGSGDPEPEGHETGALRLGATAPWAAEDSRKARRNSARLDQVFPTLGQLGPRVVSW
ncbi:hypothetical protein GCM10010840_27130 [Deinococcus aerolatus]|uniref:Uncharacterized protein n=1 Tax=Deinococcus aerolatus TaxID=522487 RepID=A0ABQ2GCW7_9DEIO|nr:hypothetical protein GCM10010840_27130 [Deinococcus aerolatus]